ncbi:hypothetical protein [Ralstonia pseudosolanacearum]|nr:hypothetical protein [Ralstonia pseudosolanacearum]
MVSALREPGIFIDIQIDVLALHQFDADAFYKPAESENEQGVALQI